MIGRDLRAETVHLRGDRVGVEQNGCGHITR
jgi:hypothetical protein